MTTTMQPAGERLDQEERSDERRGGVPIKLLLTLAVVGLVVAAFLVTSLALFTDQATSTDNVFSTGSVQIDASPATAAITMAAMIPGDQTTAPLDVQNTGTLELRYAATSQISGDEALGDALVLTIKSGVSACTNAGFTADGIMLYSGLLGTPGGLDILGDATAGSQAGDRVLAAGADETLCLNVSLPVTATNAIQGMSSAATFTFHAEQTTNNP